MKLRYNNIDYWVGWKYTQTRLGKETTCLIEIKGFVPVGKGVSVCKEEDLFIKETGRKLSLKRALNDLFPDNKEARKFFWDSYFYRDNKMNKK